MSKYLAYLEKKTKEAKETRDSSAHEYARLARTAYMGSLGGPMHRKRYSDVDTRKAMRELKDLIQSTDKFIEKAKEDMKKEKQRILEEREYQ